jgi:hypothetical protein
VVAVGESYASLEEFKAYVKEQTRSVSDDALQDALDSATTEVNRITNRVFWRSEEATPRLYTPESYLRCKVHDFYTTDGLVIETDPSGTGNFSQTWASTDYELSPLNGVVDGMDGWPWWRIRATGNFWFPNLLWPSTRRGNVRVTAKWGWESVPFPVKRATLIIAAENWKLSDAPLGVAGFNQFGVVRVRQNSAAMSKLAKFIRKPVLVG